MLEFKRFFCSEWDICSSGLQMTPSLLCHKSFLYVHVIILHVALHPVHHRGMSSQSHVSHCRVLLLGEFTVTIPEPDATLQGAVTWRNQCRDRATLKGVRIPSGILKIVFRHILFFLVLTQFRLWRAASFASSPIHLLAILPFQIYCLHCCSDDRQ